MNRNVHRNPFVHLGVSVALVTGIIVSFIGTPTPAAAEPWSFGVMGDTQWPQAEDPDGANPDNVSASIIGAINEQFLAKGVKFVLQVGDLGDRAGDAARGTRAAASQPLYNQGVGFFPLRGNHDEYGYKFGLDPLHDLNLPAYFTAFPQTKGLGGNLFGAYNFSSPTVMLPALEGLSYSFDYGCSGNNARFVIVDVEPLSFKLTQAPVDPQYGQGYYYSKKYDFTVFKAIKEWDGFTTTYDETGTAVESDKPVPITAGTWFRIDSKKRRSTNFYAEDMHNPGQGEDDIYQPIEEFAVMTKYDPAGTEKWPGDQQAWITERLEKASRGTEHAFVFSHRGLMGANHVDCFFGSTPASKLATQNPFYASLMNNGVRYMISGHDHIHNRAKVKSPDGLSQVEQLISIGASSKFYTPASLSSFPSNVKQRETEISQEVGNVGFYIYTIDGPCVTVDYYSDSIGNFQSDAFYPRGDSKAVPPVPGTLSLPAYNFVKKETWGYGLNGKEILVAQGQSYTTVSDACEGTTAAIVNGVNSSTAKDYVKRALTKSITTGWRSDAGGTLKSNILSLWGMADFGSKATDTYTLSMSSTSAVAGSFALVTKDGTGNWVKTVAHNSGGTRKFIIGPYKTTYPLGTYGIDPATKTVWAVINHSSNFAVQNSLDGDLNNDGFIDNSDVAIVTALRNQPASVKPEVDFDNDGTITLADARKLVLIRTR